MLPYKQLDSIKERVMDAKTALKKFYGYDNFRPTQEKIVNAGIEGQDILGILPTGGGKSICFQIPALCLAGATIVISPLIALMKDQIDNATANGIPAATINSTNLPYQAQNIFTQIRKGNISLLYVSPEKMSSSEFLVELFKIHQTVGIKRFVIDEAHCISQWGKDFRPSYLKAIHAIGILEIYASKQLQTTVQFPRTALTASATEKVRSDLLKLVFANRQVSTFIDSPDRPNIQFNVVQLSGYQSKLNLLTEKLNAMPSTPILIYCSSRKQVEKVYSDLIMKRYSVNMYHAGLNKDTRTQNQNDFMNDRVRIMVATNAFGMGLDKHDIRTVIHFQIPGTIDDYYQETGRAGRDGLASEALMLYTFEDVENRRRMTDSNFPTQHTYESARLLFNTLSQAGETHFAVNPRELAKMIGSQTSEWQVPVILRELVECGFLERSADIYNPIYSIADKEKQPDYVLLKDRESHARRMLQNMVDYALTPDCKRTFLLKYYAHDTHADCCNCSSCFAKGLNAASSIKTEDDEFLGLINRITASPQKTSQIDLNVLGSRQNDESLLNQLSRLRTSLSKEHKLPPFSVLSELALKEIVKNKPSSRDELLQIRGMTEKKFELIGDRILDVVSSNTPVIPVNTNIRRI